SIPRQIKTSDSKVGHSRGRFKQSQLKHLRLRSCRRLNGGASDAPCENGVRNFLNMCAERLLQDIWRKQRRPTGIAHTRCFLLPAGRSVGTVCTFGSAIILPSPPRGSQKRNIRLRIHFLNFVYAVRSNSSECRRRAGARRGNLALPSRESLFHNESRQCNILKTFCLLAGLMQSTIAG